MLVEVTVLGAARKINTTVQAGGRIEVRAPDLPLGQPVEVIIRLAHEQPNGRRSIVDILAECPGGLLFKTPEDVDAYIRQERESWER
jgi:hypothetical protein